MYKAKHPGIISTVITIIVLALLVFLTNVDIKNLSYAQSISTAVIKPVQNGFTYLKNKVTGNDAFFTDLETLEKENEELKARNGDLEEQLRELEIIKAQNASLQEYAVLKDKYSAYESVPADIIDRDISNYSSQLVINVGKKQGVDAGMTGLAEEGLVGNVVSATDNSATVQVIVDPSSSVSAMITTSSESIICKGSIDSTSELRATYIDTSSEILVGDTVVTSGIGGIYPKGITIGTVKSVVNTNNLTDRYAVVETAVDFSKLYTVLVIKN